MTTSQELLQPQSIPAPVVDIDASLYLDKTVPALRKRKTSRWKAVRSRILTTAEKQPNVRRGTLTTEGSLLSLSFHAAHAQPVTESLTSLTPPPSESAAADGCLKVLTQAESLLLEHGARQHAESQTARVTFTTVEFRTHCIILGDNPSVSSGPPVTIGWKSVESQSLNLSEYEEFREPRREKCDLILPRMTRTQWLRAAGYARSEMKAVDDQVQVIKKHRRRNSRPGLWEKLPFSVRRPSRKSTSTTKVATVATETATSVPVLTRAETPMIPRRSSYDVLALAAKSSSS